MRYIHRSWLRAIAIICYILFFIASIAIIASILDFGTISIQSLSFWDFLLYFVVCAWPAMSFLFCGRLIANIRKRDNLIHSLSDLLEQIVVRTETSLNKAKESQKDFELLAAEILKRQAGNPS